MKLTGVLAAGALLIADSLAALDYQLQARHQCAQLKPVEDALNALGAVEVCQPILYGPPKTKTEKLTKTKFVYTTTKTQSTVAYTDVEETVIDVTTSITFTSTKYVYKTTIVALPTRPAARRRRRDADQEVVEFEATLIPTPTAFPLYDFELEAQTTPPPPYRDYGLRRRQSSPPSLTWASSIISSACACLSIPRPEKQTVTDYFYATKSTKFVQTVYLTTTAYTTYTQVQTATFSITTATVTRRLDQNAGADCRKRPFNGYGTPDGDTAIIIDAGFGDPSGITNELDCCRYCHSLPNCVASAFTLDECQLLVNSVGRGGKTGGLCPLGFQDFAFGEGLPDQPGIHAGPCGY